MTLLLKPFTVHVSGFPPSTYYAASRGKALARVWGEYAATFDEVSFGQFLKLARVRKCDLAQGRFGDPIIVGGQSAYFVSSDTQYVQFVRPNSDVIMNSHPFDVEPEDYRPSSYRKPVVFMDDRELLRRAVASARDRGRRGWHHRWVAVMHVFQLGSTSAAELCRRLGFDPEEQVRA